MLQQTVVATVEPYFNRFIARFPDVRRAGGGERRRRDRAVVGPGLLRARPQPAAGGGGDRRPTTAARCRRRRQALRALPGIGPYTAAAIAAIAFGARAFALDGNAARVFARLSDASSGRSTRPRRARRCTRVAWRRCRRRRAGDFAQAVMELGATRVHDARAALPGMPGRRCLRRARGRRRGGVARQARRAPRGRWCVWCRRSSRTARGCCW